MNENQQTPCILKCSNCFLGLWFWFIKQSNSDILFFNSMSTFTQKCFSISTYNVPQELSPPKMILFGLKDISSSIRCCFRGLERCLGGKHACWPSLRSCVWIPASTCKGWGKAALWGGGGQKQEDLRLAGCQVQWETLPQMNNAECNRALKTPALLIWHTCTCTGTATHTPMFMYNTHAYVWGG